MEKPELERESKPFSKAAAAYALSGNSNSMHGLYLLEIRYWTCFSSSASESGGR